MMEKQQFLKYAVFLFFCCGLMACQEDPLDHEGLLYDLNPVGEAFMNRLKESPDWTVGWKEVLLKGEVLPNEAALLYGGGYEWHYVLPLVDKGVVVGLVIYPIEDIGQDEGPGDGRLGKPIVRIGHEIKKDVGAGSFLNTNSFNKWKKHHLKVSKEVDEAQYTWGQTVKNNIVQTRASKGYYYCYYILEFENYMDDDGYAVINGMTPGTIKDVFETVANRILTPIGLEVYKNYIYLYDLTNELMLYYLKQVEWAFQLRHSIFKVVYISGRDHLGNEVDEYPNDGIIGGGGSGGGSVGGGGGGSATPVLDHFCNPDSPLTQLQKEAIEKGINNLKRTYPFAPILFDKLEKMGIWINIELDPNMAKGTIKYNKLTKTLTFLNTDVVSSYGALEDWTHVAQYEIYYADKVVSNRNVEFEAKMFCDINCTFLGDFACAALEPGFMYDSDLIINYINFKANIASGILLNECLEEYYNLGKNWNDPNYQTGTFYELYPELLDDFLK